jgi:hypothetical protein
MRKLIVASRFVFIVALLFGVIRLPLTDVCRIDSLNSQCVHRIESFGSEIMPEHCIVHQHVCAEIELLG